MALPPRAFWTITEAAARWGCTHADIVGWASTGRLELVAGIPPVRAGAETFAGIVAIPAQDIIGHFRRDAAGPDTLTIRRIRNPGPDQAWQLICEPAEGLVLARHDLCIQGAELDRFETEHELRRALGGSATQTRWDWDSFMVAQFVRVYEDGLPSSQNEWVREGQDWFARRSNGEHPDEKTVRRRISPIWQALRSSADQPGSDA